MKAWQKGAIIILGVVGLFLIPLFNPSIVPMRFHENSDYTKEHFTNEMKAILTDEYDAIIEPEYVHASTYRFGLNFFNRWIFSKEIDGCSIKANSHYIDDVIKRITIECDGGKDLGEEVLDMTKFSVVDEDGDMSIDEIDYWTGSPEWESKSILLESDKYTRYFVSYRRDKDTKKIYYINIIIVGLPEY